MPRNKRIIKRKRIVIIAEKKDYTSNYVSKQLKKSGLVDLIDPIVENIRNNQWIMATNMVENRNQNIRDLVIQKFLSKLLGSTLLNEFNYDFVNNKNDDSEIVINTNKDNADSCIVSSLRA